MKLRHAAIVGIAGPNLNFKIPFVDTQAEAEASRVRGIAEGDEIESRTEALRQNALLIALTHAEKWDGVPPRRCPRLEQSPCATSRPMPAKLDRP